MGNFSMLPSEITLEILSRLPTESALDCKLVSKPWNNLIRHPSFSEMHFNRHHSQLDSLGKLSLLLFESAFSEDKLFRYTYAEYDENSNCFGRRTRMNLRPLINPCRVLGSCNGLICFNVSFDNDKTDSLRQPFYEPGYICNPITREYVVLPKFEENELLYGFGYVPSTNEYKVVRIRNIGRSWNDPNLGIVQIYTLGSGIGWRNAEKKMEYNVNRCSGVFANGAIHWVDGRGIILAFSLLDEEFRELPSPPCLERNGNPCAVSALYVLDDYLCAYVWGDKCLDLWVLKKNQNYHDICIWSKKFSNLPWYDQLITFTKSGGLLCRDERDNYACRYAPEASSSRLRVRIGKKFDTAIPHKNTLVSLKALGEEDTKLMDSGEGARSSRGQKRVITYQRNRGKEKISRQI